MSAKRRRRATYDSRNTKWRQTRLAAARLPLAKPTLNDLVNIMPTSSAPQSPPAEHPSKTVSWGWVIKRSALWAAILTAGVAAACALYGLAGDAEADPEADSVAAAQQLAAPNSR